MVRVQPIDKGFHPVVAKRRTNDATEVEKFHDGGQSYEDFDQEVTPGEWVVESDGFQEIFDTNIILRDVLIGRGQVQVNSDGVSVEEILYFAVASQLKNKNNLIIRIVTFAH